MKQMHTRILMAPVALVFAMLGTLACEQDPPPVPSSCYWRDEMGKALDESIATSDAFASERALRVAAVYMYLQRQARDEELNNGVHLNCEVEQPEWSSDWIDIQSSPGPHQIIVPRSTWHEPTMH